MFWVVGVLVGQHKSTVILRALLPCRNVLFVGRGNVMFLGVREEKVDRSGFDVCESTADNLRATLGRKDTTMVLTLLKRVKITSIDRSGANVNVCGTINSGQRVYVIP